METTLCFFKVWRPKSKFKEHVRYYHEAITRAGIKCKKIPSKYFVEFGMPLK